MSLRSRLDTLRRQGGAGPAQAPPTTGGDLGGRLEQATRSRRRQAGAGEEALAARLGAVRLAEGLLLIDVRLPAGSVHGRARLGAGAAEALEFFGHAPETTVFMDTETTGLAGGTGTVVFLLGLARLEPGGVTLRQYLLTGFGGEGALLAHAGSFLDGVRAQVSYNGRAFDQPLLQARYRLTGLPDPFAELDHLDLLHATRGLFARRWHDCRLQSAERELLGFRRSGDLPGADVPGVWFEWLRRGASERMPAVVRHNAWDLLSLVALVPALHHCHREPLARGADLLGEARYRHRSAGEEAAYRFLRDHRPHLDEPASLELARLARRRADWDLATALWQELGARGHPEALERMAKYHEHVSRDLDQALAFTRALIRRGEHDPRHRERERRLEAKRARRGVVSKGPAAARPGA